MKYRCCAIHDAIDTTVELMRKMATDQTESLEVREWAKKRLFDAIERQMIGVENPDGTIHVRKSADA